MSDPAQRSRRRRIGFVLLAAAILLSAIGYGLWWYATGRWHQTTDDAYVAGNIVSVTSRENATVMALYADNTQRVRQGQTLVEMDPAAADVALQAAEANLARAVRSVRGAFAGADSYRAQLAQAQVTLAQAQSDYDRRSQAIKGAVSGEELAHARDAMNAARAAAAAARSGLAQAQSSIAGTDIGKNPDVLAAEAQLRAAALARAHMRLVAPVEGVIAQRAAQLGQRVAAGTPLMAIVPLTHVWVDANFKEVQLSKMRVGQPVAVTADIYGGSVIYHGRVEGLGAGSGNAFAVLPPQNASGNWIKIVQRVPVRVALDADELKAHPLRVGLSVSADVDVHDQSGPLVSDAPSQGVMRGETGDDNKAETDALIARILADNGADKGAGP